MHLRRAGALRHCGLTRASRRVDGPEAYMADLVILTENPLDCEAGTRDSRQ